MMGQASMFAHYGVLASGASRQVDVIKMLLETTEAAVYRKVRDEFALKAEKVTEAQLDKIVIRHPKVVEMKRNLNEAKQIEGVAKTAVEAFRHRRDMLIQHGLINREEMKGDLAISVRQARDTEMETSKANMLERRKLRMEGNSEE
ncbi:MAG: hypothetical protein ACEQSB_00490 [Undibacterium sp.]